MLKFEGKDDKFRILPHYWNCEGCIMYPKCRLEVLEAELVERYYKKMPHNKSKNKKK